MCYYFYVGHYVYNGHSVSVTRMKKKKKEKTKTFFVTITMILFDSHNQNLLVVVDRFYIALFSALEQTHCARR